MTEQNEQFNLEAYKESLDTEQMNTKAMARIAARKIMTLSPQERARIRENSLETLRKLSEKVKKK